MSMRHLLASCAFAFVLAIMSGCSSGPTLVPVKGILTYKGKAVPNVHLDFYPEAGRPSWGQTDAEGKFTLEYDIDNKGAVPGKHKVFAKQGVIKELIPGERPPVPKDMGEFYDKYSAANSKVVVEITSSTKELTLAWD